MATTKKKKMALTKIFISPFQTREAEIMRKPEAVGKVGHLTVSTFVAVTSVLVSSLYAKLSPFIY